MSFIKAFDDPDYREIVDKMISHDHVDFVCEEVPSMRPMPKGSLRDFEADWI